ncbi:MAG: CHAT domain-containing protein, partial [Bacteroidetes bacterium]
MSLLKQESSSIYQVLDYWDSREFVKVVREESIQVKEVFQMLSRYENRLAIFHYAGHASGEGLYLEDDEVYAGGMAQLLGQQENLVLVFLNGCSTRGQVQMLLDAGVKAVIATSVPIGDNRAQFFAETFYQALAHRRTIKRAFHFATAALKAKYSDAPAMNLVRGLHFPDAGETLEREIEWGLYLRPESEKAVLDWRLPTYRSTGLQEQMVRYLHDHSQANKYLVTVLDAMCRFNKDIYTQLVEVVDGQEVKKDTADFMELIIRNLPWVIGSQIQLLLQKKRLDTGRLEQLISIYIATSQLLYYIVLSN